MTIFTRKGRMICKGAVALVAAAPLAACAPAEKGSAGDSGVIADTPAFYIGADSAAINGEGAVAVDGRIMRIWHGQEALTDTLPSPLPGRFTYRSSQPVVDALYALEAAAPAAAYSSATPWRAYLVPLSADSVAALLDTHRAVNVLRPAETRRYAWPVVNDDPLWLMAAAEAATVAGDQSGYRRLRQLARTLAERDAPVFWNSYSGLFQGIPTYLAAKNAGLPAWMEPTDIFECMALADNVARTIAATSLQALDSFYGLAANGYLPVTPDSLRRNINTRMWLPNLGRYSGLLYGSPAYPVQLLSSDNAAMALAILGGVASDAMTETAVRRTPVADTGIGHCTPEWNDTLPAAPPSGLLRQALWTAVCARSGNEAAYSSAVAALLYRRLRLLTDGSRPTDGSADGAVTALILRGLLGMRFIAGGIEFAPFVPENLPGEKVVEGLRYRRSTLTIRLSGTGNAISTFTIDGTPAEPFLPADMEGDHTVTITLAGASALRGVANITESAGNAMPPPPRMSWNNDRTAAILTSGGNGDSRYLVYLNGTLAEEIYRDSYTLYDAPETTTALFAPVNSDNATGFAGAPYTYIPTGQRITIPAAAVGRTGTRIVSDKTAAARLVEQNRYRNRNMTFEVEAPRAGTYLLDVRYINGLGIVNRQRRAVLRRLEVNSQPAGTLVFPQLSAAWWDKNLGEQWQELAARTNSLPVRLEPGSNTVTIRYHQPSPVYLDPAHNTVLIESINLTFLHS